MILRVELHQNMEKLKRGKTFGMFESPGSAPASPSGARVRNSPLGGGGAVRELRRQALFLSTLSKRWAHSGLGFHSGQSEVA